MTPSRWKSNEVIEWQRAQLVAAGADPSIVKDSQFRLLRLEEVCALAGLSKSSIYRGIQAGKFPAPITLSL
jgi:predicted DNA-binding transcriptional regulator AlpA